jgi:hypothetical protein
LRNVLRNPEKLPLVLANKRVVGRDITGADPFYQGHVWMLLVLSCNRLDGCHGNWLLFL